MVPHMTISTDGYTGSPRHMILYNPEAASDPEAQKPTEHNINLWMWTRT